jgi:hypothetical protein
MAKSVVPAVLGRIRKYERHVEASKNGTGGSDSETEEDSSLTRSGKTSVYGSTHAGAFIYENGIEYTPNDIRSSFHVGGTFPGNADGSIPRHLDPYGQTMGIIRSDPEEE